MIDIIDKKDCVGCNACVQRCPQQCINMHEDEQGFLYPKVEIDLCIYCNLCEKVCPVINQTAPKEPLVTYAAYNPNEGILMSSSSGGVFFALAKRIIEEGGVVFGAKFNEQWEVVHDYADTIDGIKAFQGSKYVQSTIGDVFLLVEKFLKNERKVMFTGTPCQTAALRLFLHKNYGHQLLLVDIVCHGVPSPLIWRDYIKFINKQIDTTKNRNKDSSTSLCIFKKLELTSISFRDKTIDWNQYGFSYSFRIKDNSCSTDKTTIAQHIRSFEPANVNLYMKGFLQNLFLRPSCYSCPSKCNKSNSDITIADYWGAEIEHPNFYSSMGTSLVMINTQNGKKYFNSIKIIKEKSSYQQALAHNPSIKISSPKNKKGYDTFWGLYPTNGLNAIHSAIAKMRPSLNERVKGIIKRLTLKLWLNKS